MTKMMKLIDFRSDTVTKLTEEMRDATFTRYHYFE